MLNSQVLQRRRLYAALLPLVTAITGSSNAISQPRASGGEYAPGDSSQLEEIQVTGSYIKRKNQADSASPIQMVDSEHLSQVAAFNPVDFVATMTVNNGSQNQADGFNQSFSIGTANVNLRGLGVSSTLTLLNGRRQTSSAATTLNGDQFVDLNTLIPSIAIDRVEVLEDGASSLYGSDAVAGVVNFISRKDFKGAELEVSYISTTTDSQDDLQLSVLLGKNFYDRVHWIGALNLFERDSLSAQDRRNEFEDRASFSSFGQPGTYLIFPAAGEPTRTVDPSCASVAADNEDVDLQVDERGPTCRFDFGDFFALVAEEERRQAYTAGTVTLNETTELYSEISYTDNDVTTTFSPSQPILFPQFVPDKNPGAEALGIPEGGSALAFIRPEGAGSQASEVAYDYKIYRVAVSLHGELNDEWSWETGVTYSENTFDFLDASDIKRDRFIAALNGTGGANNDQHYNPLFGADNDPAVREDFRGIYSWKAQASLLTLDGHVSGSVFNLPAGRVGVAAGLQYREDTLKYDYSEDAENDNLFFFVGNDSFDGDMDVYAVFVEADIPVTDQLSVQLALRYEDFDDEDTTDPKLGFLWTPSNEWSIRGTHGTSFRAPSIFQTAGQFRVPALIFDPLADSFATVAQLTSGDPKDPVGSQSSDTYNLGVTWDSAGLGITASVDYWRFEYTDFITPENAAAIVNANAATGAFQDQLERDPVTGDLLSVSTFFRNAGALDTDGIDVSASKYWQTNNAASFTAKLDASRILSYDLEDPVIGPVDGLGERNFTNFGVPAPELRASLGLLWASASDRHAANVFVRYTSDYKDDNNAGLKIDSFTSVDTQYQYRVQGLGDTEDGLSITFGVKNLFDAMPPDVVSRTGYDALTHNPLGRQVYVTLKQVL